MKKTLLGIIAGLSLLANVNAQSIKPIGEIDVSYMPTYYGYGIQNEQVLKTRLEAGLEFDFNKSLSAYVLGGETTYSTFTASLFPFINPVIQSYDIGAGVKLYDLEFYINHDCTHPIMSQPIIAYDSNKGYWINQSGFTEIGVKYKF